MSVGTAIGECSHVHASQCLMVMEPPRCGRCPGSMGRLPRFAPSAGEPACDRAARAQGYDPGRLFHALHTDAGRCRLRVSMTACATAFANGGTATCSRQSGEYAPQFAAPAP